MSSKQLKQSEQPEQLKQSEQQEQPDQTIYTENYILNNIGNISNLCYIVVDNIYGEEFIEKIIDHLDLKTLISNNFLSDNFLENYIYPHCDNHELMYSNVQTIVKNKNCYLKELSKLPLDEKMKKIKELNKIDQTLINLILSV